jgi:hypothetical protein
MLVAVAGNFINRFYKNKIEHPDLLRVDNFDSKPLQLATVMVHLLKIYAITELYVIVQNNF